MKMAQSILKLDSLKNELKRLNVWTFKKLHFDILKDVNFFEIIYIGLFYRGRIHFAAYID